VTWNPSQTIEASALKPEPKLWRRFMEHEEVSTSDRHGWATPRKRPRRVYKKLAARGFSQRCNGATLGSSQYKRWDFTAPRLTAWLLHCTNSAGWDTDTILVKIAPMAYALELGVLAVSKSMAHSHTLCFPRRPTFPRVLGPIDSSQRAERLSTLTLTGREYCIECALYSRRLTASVVLYTEEGPPESLTQAIENHVVDLTKALWQAAHGVHWTKRIATQTSYRPYKETAL
jgi:hypothetical protein